MTSSGTKRPAPSSASAVAERAAVVPCARNIDSGNPEIALELPSRHLLVNALTFRVLQWGLGGHRDILRCTPVVVGVAAEALTSGASSWPADEVRHEHRDEWEALPFVIEQIEPSEGHVYVSRESGDRILTGSEMYHRTLAEEGALPKQISAADYEARAAEKKEAERASRAERKVLGESAPLGVRLITVRTKQNGDCFFDAVVKAFPTGGEADGAAGGEADGAAQAGTSSHPPPDAPPQPTPRRSPLVRAEAMWRAAYPDAPLPPPSQPLTITELRGVVAAHFAEEAWVIGQQVGGDAFAFVDETSLELTRANIAKLAEEAGCCAYWADESAIAALQRYLGVRFLIFNPSASPSNRCACSADLPPSCVGPDGISFVLLRHSHRSTKIQHYELYAMPSSEAHGPRTTVFGEPDLPPGVKRAFASVCPDAQPSWSADG